MLSPGRSFVTALCVAIGSSGPPSQSFCGASHYGRATPGVGGLSPRLAITNPPILGDRDFGLGVDGARSAAPVALLLGLAPDRLQVLGAEILVQAPAVLPSVTSVAGTASFAVPIPPDPALVDLPVFAQFVVADPGAAFGVAASDALRFRLRQNNLLGATSAYQGPRASDAFSAMHYLGNGLILAGKRSSTASNRFLRSTDNGATWQVVGCPGSTGSHTYFFGQHGAVVLSGTGDTGNACLMRSSDLGASWTAVLSSSQLRALLGTASAESVFGVVHLGGGRWLANVKTRDTRNAVIESLDDGLTWRLAAAQPGNGPPDWARQMIYTNDGVLLWPAVLSDRMYRSTDQGQSWTSATVPGASLFQPLCDAGQGVYLCGEATTSPRSPIRLFRSADQGVTWTPVGSVNLQQSSVTYWRDVIALGDTLFASACCREASSQERFMQLFTSTDAGLTWCSLGNPFQGPHGGMQAIYQMCANERGEVFAACQPDSTILRWRTPIPRP